MELYRNYSENELFFQYIQTLKNQFDLKKKELFCLPVNEIHNQENLKELWFAANLLINFIDNKYLKPEGNPEYLIKWLKALILTYPTHPIMHFFLWYMLLTVIDNYPENYMRKHNLFSKTQDIGSFDFLNTT